MATFGQTTHGAGSAPNSGDRCWASKFALSAPGDITKITAFFDYDPADTSNSGDTCKAVVYADSAGSPGALLGVSAGVIVPIGDQQIDFPLSVTGLGPGNYWLGIVSNSFNSRINWISGSGGNSVRKEALTYASPANPFGTPDAVDTYIYGIYATYTASGGGATGAAVTDAATAPAGSASGGFVSVTLTNPIYTGLGSVVYSGVFVGTPAPGDVVQYPTTNGFRVDPNGEVSATSNATTTYNLLFNGVPFTVTLVGTASGAGISDAATAPTGSAQSLASGIVQAPGAGISDAATAPAGQASGGLIGGGVDIIVSQWPEVRGKTLDQALVDVDDQGLAAQIILQPSMLPAGTILDQSPLPGGDADPGSTITLYVADVSSGTNIPDEFGKTRAAGAADLVAAGFQVGYNFTVSASATPGQVIGQTPLAGTPASAGSLVILEIAIHAVATPGTGIRIGQKSFFIGL